MRLLARDPGGRYPTATDARAALLSAGADDQPAPRRRHRPRHHGRPAAAARRPPGAGTDRPAPSARAPPGGPPTPPAGHAARFADSERRWLVPTLVVVLVAVALGVAGLLLQGIGRRHLRRRRRRRPPAEPTDAPRPTTARHRPRRSTSTPRGDGEEHPDEAQAGNAFDGDPATSWSSETYSSPEWGGLQDRASASSSSSTRPAPSARSRSTPRCPGGRPRSTWPTAAAGHARRLGRARGHVHDRRRGTDVHRRRRRRGRRRARVVHPRRRRQRHVRRRVADDGPRRPR